MATIIVPMTTQYEGVLEYNYTQNTTSIPGSTTFNVTFKMRRTSQGSVYYATYSTGELILRIGSSSRTTAPALDTTPIMNSPGSSITIGSHSFTMTHNSNGEFNPISIAVYFNTNSSFAGQASHTKYNVTAPAIYNVANGSVSPASAALASTLTFTLSQHSSSNNHKVYFEYKGKRTHVKDMAAGVKTTTYAPPLSLAAQETNSLSMTGRVVFVTHKSDGTVIGERYAPLTLTIPTSIRPTLKSSGGHSIKGEANTMFSGRVLQNRTRTEVTLAYDKFNASHLHGASLARVQIQVDGTIQEFNNRSHPGYFISSSTGFTATFPPPAGSGSVAYSIRLWDTRGQVSPTYSGTITVTAYSTPNIISFSAERCTSAGVLDDTGKYAKALYNISWNTLSDTNKLDMTVTLGTTHSATLTSSPHNSNYIMGANKLLLDNSYTATLRVTDTVGSTVTKRYTLPLGFILLDIMEDGIGVGTSAKSGKFVFNADQLSLEGVMDYSYVSDTHVVKYENGVMEQWKTAFNVGAPNTARGSIYVTPNYTWNFPVAFIGIPMVVPAIRGGVGMTWAGLGNTVTTNTSTSLVGYSAVTSSGTISCSAYAIGRWK